MDESKTVSVCNTRSNANGTKKNKKKKKKTSGISLPKFSLEVELKHIFLIPIAHLRIPNYPNNDWTNHRPLRSTSRKCVCGWNDITITSLWPALKLGSKDHGWQQSYVRPQKRSMGHWGGSTVRSLYFMPAHYIDSRVLPRQWNGGAAPLYC